MTALLLVDLQNDFMPGGALAVPNGHSIIPKVNSIVPKFEMVLASQDWHPSDHVSFAVNHPGKKIGDKVDLKGISQILWPVHCVQKTLGAELVEDLDRGCIQYFFFKGTNKDIDSYSAFYDNAKMKSTGLGEFLRSKKIKKIFIAGVATDYCVLYSALDAAELGFEVFVIKDCCMAINLHAGDEKKAFDQMQNAGVKIVSSLEIP